MAEEALAAAKAAALARISAMQQTPSQQEEQPLPDAASLLEGVGSPIEAAAAASSAERTAGAGATAAAAQPAADNHRSQSGDRAQQKLRVAVQGCAHGELDSIYATIAEMESSQGVKIDLLLCCGDFQAVRFKTDLECMAVPAKFRRLGTFYRYCKELMATTCQGVVLTPCCSSFRPLARRRHW